MRFNRDQVPLIFTQLEEVRRSLARLCFQRNRLEKEVRNLRIKRKEINQLGDAGESTATDNKRIGQFIWIKKVYNNQLNYTSFPCIKEQKKKRNHRGYRKKRQDYQAIISRCNSTFSQLSLKAQTLPSLLAQLPALINNCFQDYSVLLESLVEIKRNNVSNISRPMAFKGSTPL